MDLLIATENAHKVREMRAMLKQLASFDLYTLVDFPEYVSPPEEGSSFEEIAQKKALDAAMKLNIMTLADDSGLVVPALNGQPGVFSKRYSGLNATDKENRQKLLREMTNLEGIARSAYFECALAIASPKGILKSVRGIVEGEILETPRGSNGFGYDPLFVKHEYHQSFAELDEQTKNRISHRAKAMRKLSVFLESFL